MNYTDTASWQQKGAYVVTRPSSKLVELLRPYEVNDKIWGEKILKANKPL